MNNSLKVKGFYFIPNFHAISRAQPELIIGCEFPHQIWLRQLQNIAPVVLLKAGGNLETTYQELQFIAGLLNREALALAEIEKMSRYIEDLKVQTAKFDKPLVLMMGGSCLNIRKKKFTIETDLGAFGSVAKELGIYGWPQVSQQETGLDSMTLASICQRQPKVIFVQSYPWGLWRQPLSLQLASHPLWASLSQRAHVYEVAAYWHNGRGPTSIRQRLMDLLPRVFPDLNQGIRQRDLCERMGWAYRDVAQRAKAMALSTHQYVQQETGWILFNELYYAPHVPTEDYVGSTPKR